MKSLFFFQRSEKILLWLAIVPTGDSKMMYMFIKMSSKWFCAAFNFDLDDDLENMKIHIENGNIVCFADDIETFAMEMDIEVAEIEMTE